VFGLIRMRGQLLVATIGAIILVLLAVFVSAMPAWWFPAEGNFDYYYSIKPELLRDWFYKDWVQAERVLGYGIREDDLKAVNWDVQKYGFMTLMVSLNAENKSTIIHYEQGNPFYPPNPLIPLDTILYNLERLGFREGDFSLEYIVTITLSVDIADPELGGGSLGGVEYVLARVFMTVEDSGGTELSLSISSVESHPLELTFKIGPIRNPRLLYVKTYGPLLLSATAIILLIYTISLSVKNS